jgi:hypothetical protein
MGDDLVSFQSRIGYVLRAAEWVGGKMGGNTTRGAGGNGKIHEIYVRGIEARRHRRTLCVRDRRGLIRGVLGTILTDLAR